MKYRSAPACCTDHRDCVGTWHRSGDRPDLRQGNRSSIASQRELLIWYWPVGARGPTTCYLCQSTPAEVATEANGSAAADTTLAIGGRADERKIRNARLVGKGEGSVLMAELFDVANWPGNPNRGLDAWSDRDGRSRPTCGSRVRRRDGKGTSKRQGVRRTTGRRLQSATVATHPPEADSLLAGRPELNGEWPHMSDDSDLSTVGCTYENGGSTSSNAVFCAVQAEARRSSADPEIQWPSTDRSGSNACN